MLDKDTFFAGLAILFLALAPSLGTACAGTNTTAGSNTANHRTSATTGHVIRENGVAVELSFSPDCHPCASDLDCDDEQTCGPMFVGTELEEGYFLYRFGEMPTYCLTDGWADACPPTALPHDR